MARAAGKGAVAQLGSLAGQVVDDGAAAAPLPQLGRINNLADIAGAVAYLVSLDARNVSGQLITVADSLNPAL
ncbi:MAG TPA: hypothetical protein VMK84_04305 [Streptosporangiaceae bacterium]|jgi:hypothetical protein|nr:hypothetical protein [Streptosporangiaceae bacterium]